MDNYVGKRLDGRYEIREIIGVGGMAVVYKAYDNIDDRIVAIKILKDEFLANEEFRRRFKNESKAIAVLSHPNIVKVYDVSLGDKLQYIVMEYVEGITLKEYIEQQGVIEWKEAVHFSTQILRALQHAHDKGIVHRDIKPQNIMLLENGTIKVTDFGIARFSRGETRTMTEAAIGSVHYISPEQARGEITDDKADIYSVGVVLYEMITGQLPFESDNAVSVALMQLQNEAVPPREIKPDLPIGLEQITLHAMEKNTKNRYQSAAEMLLDLDELRRNPSIKFDYSYFVDKEPTKFINRESSTGRIHTSVPGGIRPVGGDAQYASDDTMSYYTPAQQGKKKTGLIIAAVVIGVAALAILLTVVLKSAFSGKQVAVPSFLGMNYAEEIDGKYDDFKFDVTYVTSTTYDEGQVSKQSPDSGTKVKKGSTIKLEVVASGTTEKIPKIYGLTVNSAENLLKEAGFTNINKVTEYSKKDTPGTVIRSNPKEGEEADVSEVVVLYVATDDNGKTTDVPDLTGLNYYSDKSAVENILSSNDLKLGNVTEKDSSDAKGVIIDQSPVGGTEVDQGSTVNIVVSSGKAIENSVTITITLPTTGTAEKYQLYVGNELVKSSTVLCNGANYHSTVKSSGSGVPIEVYVGGSKVYEATADFTTDPVTLTNVQTYTPETTTKSSGLNIGDVFGQ